METVSTGKKIYQALGGARFMDGSGCRNALSDGTDLGLILPKNKSGANRMYIEVGKNGTLTMNLFKLTTRKSKGVFKDKIVKIDTLTNIDFFELADVFHRVTGLSTGRVY